MAKNRKLSVDDETYALVAGYRAERTAIAGKELDMGSAACELIAEGVRAKRAGLWEGPFANELRKAMRNVAENDRNERIAENDRARLDMDARALEIKASAFAVLLAQGFSPDDVADIFYRGLELAADLG